MTFRNTPNYESPADSNRDNEYLVSVRASDGRYYGYFNVTVTVEDVNEPPEINTGSRTEFTFRENGTGSLYTFRATDPERGTITWLKAGVDATFFTIDERLGPCPSQTRRTLRPGLTRAGTMYMKSRSRQGTTLSTPHPLDVTVTVTDVNEGPEVSGRGSYTVPENGEPVRGVLQCAVDPGGGRHHRLEPVGHRRRRLHHQRERPVDLQERPRLRGSGRLQPGQRIPGLRQGLRRPVLRLLRCHR